MIETAEQEGTPVKYISQCNKNLALAQLLTMNLSGLTVRPIAEGGSEYCSSEDFSLNVSQATVCRQQPLDFCPSSSFVEVNPYLQ
jgi:hypothetical protein